MPDRTTKLGAVQKFNVGKVSGEGEEGKVRAGSIEFSTLTPTLLESRSKSKGKKFVYAYCLALLMLFVAYIKFFIGFVIF